MSTWLSAFEAAAQHSNEADSRLVVATVSPDGIPSLRTVTLRGISQDGEPFFVTHSRSRKVDHLEYNPRVALLAWYSKTREQFRLSGSAALWGAGAHGTWASTRQGLWTKLEMGEKHGFLGPPPGRPYVPQRPLKVPALPPPEFLVVSVKVLEVDWLTEGSPSKRIHFRWLGSAWVQEALSP